MKIIFLYCLLFVFLVGDAVLGNILEVSTHHISFHVKGNVVKIPYYRNFSIGANTQTVRHVVIVVHGTNRNANDYYDSMMSAAWKARAVDTVHLIMAPQFLIEKDMQNNNLSPDILFWKSQGWKKGDRSISTSEFPTPVSLSSFSVLDSILLRLVKTYSKLDTIIITGHSAGGQYVQRYAAGNPLDSVLLNDYGVSIRYIPANPSSYVYLNKERRVEGTIDQFAVPNTFCKFNDYKYGLDNLNKYMSSIRAEQIRRQYAVRNVVYLLGEKDDNPDDSSLDKTCEALFQGSYRLERGNIYYNYVGHYYGSSVYEFHKKAIVPDVGHDHDAMFNSECGIYFIFNYGNCSTTSIRTMKNYSDNLSLFLAQNYPNPFNSSTKIKFQLSKGQHIKLEIINILGKTVQTLRDGFENSGKHEVVFNALNLPSGIYYCRLQAGAAVHIRKMINLK